MKNISYIYLVLLIINTLLITWCNNQQSNLTTSNTSSSQSSSNWINNSWKIQTWWFMPTWINQKWLDNSNIKTKYTDIVYANDSSTQKLDIYLPNDWKWPFPVILAIHGGAFKMWNKNGWDLSAMLKGVEKWYAVVCIDYRLSDEAIFPATIDDIQKAIIFLKNNSNKYSLDPNKFAVWWDSAWWNLASLAGTMWDKNNNTNVQAVVDWFWPICFSRIDQQFSELWITPIMGKTNIESSPESKYIGKTIWTQEAEILVKKASPETYISSDDPAFLIQHWTADRNIPITQSEDFAKSLENTIWKDKVVFMKLDWAGHGGEKFESDENLTIIFDFLNKNLK